MEYTYDVFGNRIQRSETANSKTTVERHLVDGWDTAKPSARGSENFDTWADLDANNQLVTRRVYGAGFDQPLLKESTTGERAWYNTDHIGSVRKVFDNSGAITGQVDYSAFGVQNVIVAGGIDRYQFTGREFDGTLNLQYSRARMYDPNSGRFIGEDRQLLRR